jgi:PAT family acetyl-CoA transporter-like MFS transporter 1
LITVSSFSTMEVRHRLENTQSEHTDEPSSSSESDNESNSSISKQNDWKKDRWSITLLLFLYLLQGIPLGMAASIPLIIQTYGASWSQQATFSFAFWPFSLKLLWAPLVDAIYSKKFGRRKTWLIPVQYAIGFCMILLSYYINDILHQPSPNHHPRMFRSDLK